MFPSIQFSLPQWVGRALPPPLHRYKSDEEKMMLVIELSRLNIENGTGGPFGAAVFDIQNQRLVAPGVNLVETICWSGAHAEMVAIAITQKLLGKLDLGSSDDDQYELFSSTEPCAMCLGGITWSGVRRLVHGARDQDARAIGFDEGIKAREWLYEFKLRGIDVVQDVYRDKASRILQMYKRDGGLIYNGRTNTPME
jgi:tRNA(Arg) A34 adenosine deaminase TadA